MCVCVKARPLPDKVMSRAFRKPLVTMAVLDYILAAVPSGAAQEAPRRYPAGTLGDIQAVT